MHAYIPDWSIVGGGMMRSHGGWEGHMFQNVRLFYIFQIVLLLFDIIQILVTHILFGGDGVPTVPKVTILNWSCMVMYNVYSFRLRCNQGQSHDVMCHMFQTMCLKIVINSSFVFLYRYSSFILLMLVSTPLFRVVNVFIIGFVSCQH